MKTSSHFKSTTGIPEKVSLIVIGGGITGLSTALTWAKNKPAEEFPVLVIEKEAAVGGYVTSFKRENFLFDTVQFISDPTDLLEYFGIEIELRKYEGDFVRLFLADTTDESVKRIDIPAGYENFKNFMFSHFKEDEKQLLKFFNYSDAIFEELYFLKVEPTPGEIIRILLNCPKIIAQSGKTWEQYLKKFRLKNRELKEIMEVFAAFSGLSSKRVASLLPVSAMLTSLKGSYRPYRGFIEFPLRMKQRLTELGGKILNQTKVDKILVNEGKAVGVRLENGKTIYAGHVVTTIDAKVAMQKLVGTEVLKELSPSYSRKVDKMIMSASSLMINLGLDDLMDLKAMGFDCGYNLLTTGNGIYDKLYDYYDQGELYRSPHEFFIPVICQSAGGGKKNALTIFVYPVAMGDWNELREKNHEEYLKRKEEISDFYIEMVEKYMIPGLRKHIVMKDIATPATFMRYSGSPTGSKFDMAPYPGNFGKNRLKMRTPVKNLYQPKFSHGIWPSMQAGIQVVDMILHRQIMDGNSRYGQ